MNGPEHYRRAEALLDACRHLDLDVDDEGRDVESYTREPYDTDNEGQPVNVHGNALMAALTHATLALAAAVAEGVTPFRRPSGEPDAPFGFDEGTEWGRVLYPRSRS